MKRPRRPAQDPIEGALELALCPGQFINYNASWSFVDGLEGPARSIEELVKTDAARAVRLCETYLAGCYEKAEELDDSSGNFGMFVDGLFDNWIKARQAAGADPDETARWLLARMDDDPYGFAYHLEREAAKVMNEANLAAFARRIRARFDGHAAGAKEKARDAQYVRRRWGEVLRAIHAAQKAANPLTAAIAGALRPRTWRAQQCTRFEFTNRSAWVIAPSAEADGKLMANETRSELLRRSEEMWRRLLNEGIKPHAEELALIFAAGNIAMVVFEPNENAKPDFQAMGWDGKAAVFPMSNAVRELMAKVDTVTEAWLNREPKPGVGRLFVCSGIGTLLVNYAAGRGFWIEPGSLESEWV